MATFTALSYLEAPHWGTGVQALMFRYTSQEPFGSVGDVLLLGKLPSPVDILDVNLQSEPGPVSTGAGYTYSIFVTPGNSSSATSTLGSVKTASVSAGSNIQAVGSAFDFPRISLSDGDAIQYSVLKMRINAADTATASFSLIGYILYQIPPK